MCVCVYVCMYVCVCMLCVPLMFAGQSACSRMVMPPSFSGKLFAASRRYETAITAFYCCYHVAPQITRRMTGKADYEFIEVRSARQT